MVTHNYSINVAFQDVFGEWNAVSFSIGSRNSKVSREEALNWAETLKASENIMYIDVYTTDASMFFTPMWEWRRYDCAAVRRGLTMQARKDKEGHNNETK